MCVCVHVQRLGTSERFLGSFSQTTSTTSLHHDADPPIRCRLSYSRSSSLHPQLIRSLLAKYKERGENGCFVGKRHLSGLLCLHWLPVSFSVSQIQHLRFQFDSSSVLQVEAIEGLLIVLKDKFEDSLKHSARPRLEPPAAIPEAGTLPPPCNHRLTSRAWAIWTIC